MGRFLKWFAVALVAALSFSSVAKAQNPYSAAYAVNDSIISYFDIDQRVKLLGALGFQGGDVRKVATEQLINDRLKLSAARDVGIQLAAGSLERGIAAAAENAGISADALWAKARARGVSRDAFEEYYTAQIIWREMVQAKFRQFADPTSIDIDNAINVAAAVTQETILLAEIALPFAERGGEEATMAFATRLSSDLNKGANFEDAVQRFSRSPSAANGGRIGWVAPERLPAAIAAQVLGLPTGQVSAPIKVSSGAILLKVIGSRVVSSPLQKQVSVRYAVLNLSGRPNAGAEAARLQRRLDECQPSKSTAANYGEGSGLFGPVSVNEVPADIALALARLMPGRSEVLVNGDSVQLVQLCNRTTDLDEQTNAQLTNNLFGTKLGKLAEGYLLELRRGAVIEKR